MKLPGRSQRASLSLAAGLFVLLGVLATLQYRWLGQVSEAELQRMRASLYTAAAHFADDFDREIARVFISFETNPSSAPDQDTVRLARQYTEWLSTSPYPRLIRDLFVARGQEGHEFELQRFDPASSRLEPVAWPVELDSVRQRMQTQERRWPTWAGGPPRGSLIVPEVPALLVPLSRFSAAAPDEAVPPPRHVVIVGLDLDYIRTALFPALAARYFSSPKGLDEVITVVQRDDSKSPIYRSDTGTASPIGPGDASAELLSLRRVGEFRSVSQDAGPAPQRAAAPEGGPDRFSSPRPADRIAGPPPFPFSRTSARSGHWRLVVTQRSESLEAAVARLRRRNLAVGFGILAVLAASVAMISVSARQAQRLAHQQIEFVAGVTHELNTPLTVIRSAAQNLADGVVAQPGQVRRYGSLIESEGRRLSEMVTRVLEFAGMQSARSAYRLRPVPIEPVLDEALANCRGAMEQNDFRIEKVVPSGLPPVLADPAALARALQNLIENAMKYGAAQRWVQIRAAAAVVRGLPGVAITVEDRGSGISDGDLPHIFEPFYRGKNAIAGAVAGSGLGLSLVKHIVDGHGGLVTVTSNTGATGTSFTLSLRAATGPAAPEPAQTEP
jgi:signal transduction histidine kinase